MIKLSLLVVSSFIFDYLFPLICNSLCFFLLDFEKASLLRYLENFNEIYQEYDRLIQHEDNYSMLKYYV